MGKHFEEMQKIADTQMYKGFPLNSIEAAWKQIADPQDWKGPIDIAVPGESVSLAVAAIQFYTATTPTMRLELNSMQYLLSSPGYRMGPAGDH